MRRGHTLIEVQSMSIPQTSPDVQRRRDLVAIGIWAIASGRGWLVHAVFAALVREGLAHE
jgi:hypothetical protein